MTNENEKGLRALQHLLMEWRGTEHVTLYQIAKAGGSRVEKIYNCESRDARMSTLVAYLLYIAHKDRNKVILILTQWLERMGI